MALSLFRILVLMVICKSSIEEAPVYSPGGLTSPQISLRESKNSGKSIKNGSNRFVTETVYGFMDFTTTVGSTVMVFTPQSKADDTATSSKLMSTVTNVKADLHTTHIANTPKKSNFVPSIPATGLAKLLKDSRFKTGDKSPAKRKIVEGKSSNSPVMESAASDLNDNKLNTFDNELLNKVDKKYNYDYLALEPSPSISDDYSIVDIKAKAVDKPTGLVTTLGGTIISDGHTTIHKTSVIGTYVGNKYAQILESTSKIFKDNKLDATPTYETIKAVIEGSATQFFKPESTAILSNSILPTVTGRAPRYETDSLHTRRADPNAPAKYDYYYDVKDQNYDDEYDEFIRAGSGVHPSFVAYHPQESVTATPVLHRNEQSTYRPRSKTGGTRNIPPSFLRNTPPDQFRNSNRFQSPVRSKVSNHKKQSQVQASNNESPKFQRPQSLPSKVKKNTEETVSISSRAPVDGSTNVWYEIKILRSLHEFRVGTTKNTRYVTYTKTITHSIEPTSVLEFADSKNSEIYVEKPLFENVLQDKNLEIATLPPINLNGRDINDILSTTVQTFRTTETMYKTSVLPVKVKLETIFYTLTQTYLITRVVSAIKTVPPIDAFEFVPSNSLNEFNDKLLAEGTENEAALLPGEQETIENKEVRVSPPSDLLFDPNLSNLAGGKFNPDALEKQSTAQSAPNKDGTQQTLTNSPNAATPALSPEALQLAYLRLMNPYMFGGFPGAQAQQTVTSSPVIITTDVVTTSTQVLRVIFNARPIMKTISNTGTVRTTITTYSTTTITAQPAFSFPFPPPIPLLGG